MLHDYYGYPNSRLFTSLLKVSHIRRLYSNAFLSSRSLLRRLGDGL
jgi:hypothetical protein